MKQGDESQPPLRWAKMTGALLAAGVTLWLIGAPSGGMLAPVLLAGITLIIFLGDLALWKARNVESKRGRER